MDESHGGYIERIRLENFMCHRNFVVDLKPGLNILVGQNGSGKSSILTALMICLGARATETSRGDSLASLIRTGTLQAFITVDIVASPRDTTLVAKHGLRFSVTRRISIAGGGRASSQYQIKRQDGRISGTRREDVNEITFHLGIFPNNPIAILTQEEAKQFLVGKSAHAKYQRLKQALHQFHREVTQREIDTSLSDQQAQLELLQSSKERLQDELGHLNHRLLMAREIEDAERRIQRLRGVLEWRKVQRMTEALVRERVIETEMQNQLSAHESPESLDLRISSLKNDAEQAIARREEAMSEAAAAEARVDIATQDESRARSILQSIKSDVSENRTKLENAQEVLKRVSEITGFSTRESIIQRRNQLQKSIAEQTAKLSQDGEYTEQLLQDDVEAKTTALSTAESDLRDVKRRLKELSEHLSEVQGRAARSNFEQGGLPPGFDASVRKLVRAIDEEKRWKIKPVGPLGAFVEVREDAAHWSGVLETLLSSHLLSFWVQSDADHQLLRMHMKRAGVRDTRVVVRRDDPFKFDHALPPASDDYKRLFEDVLVFRRPDVARIFVDQASIEGAIVAHNEKSANRYTRDRSFRVNSAYYEVGSATRRRFMAITGRANGLVESAPISVYTGRPRMVLNRTAQKQQQVAAIRQLGAEVREFKEANARAEEQRSAAMQALKESKMRLSGFSRNTNSHKQALRDFEDELRRLPDPDTAEDEFGARVRDAATAVDDAKMELSNSEEALSQGTSEAQAAAERRQLAQRERATFQQQITEYERASVRLRREAQSLEGSKSRLVTQLTHIQNNLQEQQEKVVSLTEAVKRAREDAEQKGPDPQLQPEIYDDGSLLNLSDIEVEKEISDALALQEQAAITPEALVALRQQKEEQEKALSTTEQALDHCKHYRNWSMENNDMRKARDERFWRDAKAMISETFQALLAERNFTGGVVIDDIRGVLETEVTPEAASEKRSNANLSGGERSFSQIALLMSVWETMKVGLVAMDEYDVFMDKGNRAKSLNLLSSSVVRHNMQCILITPQDVDLDSVDPALVGNIMLHHLNAARPV